MKLSYTTLACPAWEITRILSVAIENHYDAIDFRGYLGITELPDSPAFQGQALHDLAARVQDSGIAVSCLSSGAGMSTKSPEARIRALDAMKRYAELCHAFHCDMVRIFGGDFSGIPDPTANAAETLVAANAIALDAGIRFVVETHDSWTQTAQLQSALAAADSPSNIGFLWDVHHPYRFQHEAPSTSAQNLRERLWNTHWKDSRSLPTGGYQLCLPGQGDIPLAESFAALQAIHYDGYYTLEWEKKWHPEIEEPDIAIPAFASFIRTLAATI